VGGNAARIRSQNVGILVISTANNGVELLSKVVTTPATCAKDKYLVGFDCRFKRIFRKGELCALRLIRNLQATIRQKPGGTFVLVTAHCIFTIAEICEGTEEHLAVEEFLSPYPLVVVLEKTVAQCQPLLSKSAIQ
jgi:hypothetical protein